VDAADLHTTFPGNSILKYADDTYLIIPASNIQTRAAELQNVEHWALTNKLKLNRMKTNEIIIAGSRNKSLNSPPPNLPGIEQVASLKILGVTISNKLSVGEHVQQTVSRCAQSFHHFMPSGYSEITAWKSTPYNWSSSPSFLAR